MYVIYIEYVTSIMNIHIFPDSIRTYKALLQIVSPTFTKPFKKKKSNRQLGVVAHTCNTNYSGGHSGKIVNLRTAQAT
jgi:hypothetical protein